MTEKSYLERILAAKRADLAGRRGNTTRQAAEVAMADLPTPLDFVAALAGGPGPRVIAEFKRASPVLGDIRADADPRHLAALFVDAGAACIAVLTDAHYKGCLDDLRAIRSAVSVPILCSDFILSRGQIDEARIAGADAITLIAAALEPPTLRDLVKYAEGLGLAVLCEAHTAHEIDRAMAAGARLIAATARDPATFEIDRQRPIELRPAVPEGFTYVAEGGIKTREDIARLREANVHAILVGTQLMSAEDPGIALSDLMAME